MSVKPIYDIDDRTLSYLINHSITTTTNDDDDKKISLESTQGFDGLFDKNFLKSMQAMFNNSSSKGILSITRVRELLLQKVTTKHADMLCKRLDINNTGYTKFATVINCLISAEEGRIQYYYI